MNILGAIEKVPGGIMVIPLLLGATVNTFLPGLLEIGGFTQALFKEGALPVIGAFLFCMGAQIPIRATGPIAEKGFAILIGKLLAGVIVALIAAFLMPSGTLLALSPLAIVAAMTNSNSGMYVALTEQFGNKTDTGAVSVISLNDGPFLTLLVLGAAGLASIPLLTFIGVVAPVLLGFILGNLDENLRRFLAPGQRILIPFFAFPLGAGIDFKTLIEAGLPGVLLGLLTLVVSGGGAMLLLALVHRIRRRPHYRRNIISGACESSTAGAAVATPAVVAAADPAYKAIEATATAQVAGSTVTTAILTPVLALLIYRWQMKRGIDPQQEFEDEPMLDDSAVAEPATRS
ncbi:2-keto-3-deoxygluconate permease [Kushneria phosphatilytica]|uniref:2-keto-3-deoxygluconate permease n=1 Tax=Kushneria phosphatilytica TaxID=657387 RepID=A0A1S1NS61_9GAMM|nr:2-keto-3-deoxygluconate permease [Kushneria phosphatilytica]OHV08336.1 2-keto-3-deoxygluconate permease [Kushneria phosphatilytica]QEL09751.1 2-keto-3-deoxygluconate permease [Kushneria phosphatilytica]